MTISFFSHEIEIRLPPGFAHFEVDSRTYSSDRPCWAQYLRIYQRVPHAMSGDTWDVLRDAIIDGNRDLAGQILATDDVIPGWRRSSAEIEAFTDHSSNRLLFSNVMAGVIWDVNLEKMVVRGEGFRLRLANYSDHPIVVRPFIICRPFTEDEFDRLRGGR